MGQRGQQYTFADALSRRGANEILGIDARIAGIYDRRMTKKYILIEVDDSKVASALLKKLKQITNRGARVVGFFVTPDDDFCTCGALGDRQQAVETVRGAKYGWIVHRVCGKPRSHSAYHPANLLEAKLPIRNRRFYITTHGEN